VHAQRWQEFGRKQDKILETTNVVLHTMINQKTRFQTVNKSSQKNKYSIDTINPTIMTVIIYGRHVYT
jgi:hypothetical protein